MQYSFRAPASSYDDGGDVDEDGVDEDADVDADGIGRGLAEHLLLPPEDRWQMGQAAALRYLRSSRKSRCYATPFII